MSSTEALADLNHLVEEEKSHDMYNADTNAGNVQNENACILKDTGDVVRNLSDVHEDADVESDDLMNVLNNDSKNFDVAHDLENASLHNTCSASGKDNIKLTELESSENEINDEKIEDQTECQVALSPSSNANKCDLSSSDSSAFELDEAGCNVDRASSELNSECSGKNVDNESADDILESKNESIECPISEAGSELKSNFDALTVVSRSDDVEQKCSVNTNVAITTDDSSSKDDVQKSEEAIECQNTDTTAEMNEYAKADDMLSLEEVQCDAGLLVCCLYYTVGTIK